MWWPLGSWRVQVLHSGCLSEWQRWRWNPAGLWSCSHQQEVFVSGLQQKPTFKKKVSVKVTFTWLWFKESVHIVFTVSPFSTYLERWKEIYTRGQKQFSGFKAFNCLRFICGLKSTKNSPVLRPKKQVNKDFYSLEVDANHDFKNAHISRIIVIHNITALFPVFPCPNM